MYVFVVAFSAVTVSYVLVGFVLAGRTGTGRVAAVLLGGGATVALWTFGYAVGGELVFHAPLGEFSNAVLCSDHWRSDRAWRSFFPAWHWSFRPVGFRRAVDPARRHGCRRDGGGDLDRADLARPDRPGATGVP